MVMASTSPSPVHLIPARSPPTSDSALSVGSPHLSGSFLQEHTSPSKVGLVSGQNGQRSYGTVKKISSSYKRSSVSVINHILVEGDTLQGLALKYDVTVSLPLASSCNNKLLCGQRS